MIAPHRWLPAPKFILLAEDPPGPQSYRRRMRHISVHRFGSTLPGRHALGAAIALLVVAAVVPCAHATDVTLGSAGFVKLSHKNGLGSLPESSVIYRVVPYVATDDIHTVIRGRVPKARLWAFSIYETLLRPIDALPDRQIHIGRGGRYRITVEDGCHGKRNCLDASRAPDPELRHYAFIGLRLYLPVDLHEGETGGVPLPEVTYVGNGRDAALDLGALSPPLESALVDGALSAFMDAARAIAAANGPFPGTVEHPDNDPRPSFGPLVSTKEALLRWAGENALPTAITDGLRGIKLPFLDAQFASVNTYYYTTFDLSRGNLVLRFRAPSYRRSAWGGRPRNDLARRNGGEQLRYWSICTYKVNILHESGCMRDSLFRVGRNGRVTAVVAPRCPVRGFRNCLATGSTSFPDFAIVVRNTLPSGAFAGRQLRGDYAMRARYVRRLPAAAP